MAQEICEMGRGGWSHQIQVDIETVMLCLSCCCIGMMVVVIPMEGKSLWVMVSTLQVLVMVQMGVVVTKSEGIRTCRR